MRADRLEQIFLRRKGGVFEVLLVLESPAGGRQRVTLTAPPGGAEAAVDFVARYLEREGAGLTKRPRLRLESAAGTHDDQVLLARLVAAVASSRRHGEGDSRRWD